MKRVRDRKQKLVKGETERRFELRTENITHGSRPKASLVRPNAADRLCYAQGWLTDPNAEAKT